LEVTYSLGTLNPVSRANQSGKASSFGLRDKILREASQELNFESLESFRRTILPQRILRERKKELD
jgi:hypothetical protein